MIEKTLEKLGFQNKESSIYMELMKRGKATPATLARTTGINRATVYSVSKTLIKKGVIAEDLAGKSRYLVALPANDLERLIIKQEQNLQKTKRLVHNVIDELAELPQGTQYSVPQIRFVEDENIEDHLYKNVHAWDKSITMSDKDKRWWGFQDHTFAEHYKDWIVWYWHQSPEEIDLRLLSNKSDIEERMEKEGLERRQIAFWENAHQFDATTWVIGDYIVMIYTKERPFYLIEIHNPVLARNMRHVFKGIWKDIKR